MWFEFGDPKQIMEKLGDKMLITGLYPVSSLRLSKQEVCDRAKALLDITMPYGSYNFGFDKNPFVLSEVNMDNWEALSRTVSEYGVYKNAGESFGTPLNSEGFVYDPSAFRPIDSKYLVNWEDFKAENPLAPDFAAKNLDAFNHDVLNFFMYLLV